MEQKTPYQSIILIGQAGCGKGTQAELLAEELGYEIFSTGDKAREFAALDSPLGKRISEIHTTGWIPEWLASYVMTKAILEEFSDHGLVFESVARKPEEARKLHDIHTAIGRSYLVLHLECDIEVVKERMLKRGREDYDTEDKIDSRLAAFQNETMDSIKFFKEQGVLKVINANQSPEDTHREVLNNIKG